MTLVPVMIFDLACTLIISGCIDSQNSYHKMDIQTMLVDISILLPLGLWL